MATVAHCRRAMHCRLSVLLLGASLGQALNIIALSGRPTLSRSGRTCCLAAPSTGDDGAINRTSADLSRSSRQLEKEFSTFVSPRVVVSQSRPVRYTVGAARDLQALLQRFVEFWNNVFAALPLSRLIFILTVAAYVGQQTGGRAVTFAGARINGLILQAHAPPAAQPIPPMDILEKVSEKKN